MKIQEIDSTTERTILLGHLTDDLVAARIAEQWPERGGLYASKYANLLGGWAVDHIRKYGHAPKDTIEQRAENWSNKSKDTDTVSSVMTIIESLSGEWDKANAPSSQWIIDQAQDYFTRVKGEKHIRKLQAAWDSGDVAAYEAVANGWAAPVVSSAQWIDILRNDAGIDLAYAQLRAPLLQYPEPLNTWLGNTFERDSFVCFTGVSKGGKSYTLMDAAARGLEAGWKVAYFCIGDMSEAQVLRRWGSRITGLPRRLPEGGVLHIPVGFDPESAVPEPLFAERKFSSPATPELVKRASRMLRARIGAVADDDVRLRLSVHPAGSVDVYQIEALLRSWQLRGWVPDIIVIDYADLIRPSSKARDERDGINTTWIHLRGISQIYHCCLITATQSDAAGYDAPRLTAKNFSGDRRKNDHVTANIGIATTPAERKLGIVRWGEIKFRDEPPPGEIAVLGSLAICQPVLYAMYHKSEEDT